MIRPQEVNNMSLAFLYKNQLERCKVRPDETVILVTNLSVDRKHIEAAFAAASEIGCGIYEICVNSHFSSTHLGGEHVQYTKGSMQAIEDADLVIAYHVTLGTDWMARGREAGTRFMMILDAPDDLARLSSPPGLKEAIKYGRDKLANAKELRIVNDSGTDFRCALGEFITVGQWGYADEPSHVDQWGVGHIATWPNVGSAQGTVILRPGDRWILPYVRYIEDDVRLTIENGVIVDVEGKTDARMFRDFSDAHKESPDDDKPYHVGHIGWPISPDGLIDTIAVNGPDMQRVMANGRAWAGSFLWSTGPNDQGGGTNRTKAHVDFPLFGCTVMLDNEVVIENGKIVDEKMIVAPTYPTNVAA